MAYRQKNIHHDNNIPPAIFWEDIEKEIMQKDLVEFITKSLVDNPDDVKVREVEGEQTSVIELSVAKEDLGKIIGKQGRTARAIRTLLGAVSAKAHKRIVLEILE